SHPTFIVPSRSCRENLRLSPGMSSRYVTHKLDFHHLWNVFEERGVADDEEVIVIWQKSNLRGVPRRLSRMMPGLIVWICRQGAFEIANDPRPLAGLEFSAWQAATDPIVRWEPDVLAR